MAWVDMVFWVFALLLVGFVAGFKLGTFLYQKDKLYPF